MTTEQFMDLLRRSWPLGGLDIGIYHDGTWAVIDDALGTVASGRVDWDYTIEDNTPSVDIDAWNRPETDQDREERFKRDMADLAAALALPVKFLGSDGSTRPMTPEDWPCIMAADKMIRDADLSEPGEENDQ